MAEIFQSLLATFGVAVAALGGLGLIAFQIFRWLGASWLSAKFDERLEAFKSAQLQQLEQLKFKINALLDRTTKLHEKEFEVLPEAWALVVDSYYSVLAFVSPVRFYADVNRMTDTQLTEFLNNSEFDKWEIEKIRTASNKNKTYQESVFWHQSLRCRTACKEFN